MRVVLLKKKLFEKREGFVVGGEEIRAFQGYFEISKRELDQVIRKATAIWKRVFALSGANENYRAHIRFDFVPSFEGEVSLEQDGYFIGNLQIKDLYEINTHSPECMSCDALFREVFPEIAKNTPSATGVLARAIKKECSEEIVMVKGDVVTRNTWLYPLLRELEREGLKTKVLPATKVRKEEPANLWRWGNIDFREEYGEFDSDFQKWLFRAQKRVTLFNSILKQERDTANKGFLLKDGEFLINSKENLKKALLLNKDDYVLKPLIGTSGKGIVFGSKVSKKTFQEALQDSFQKKGYGVFKEILLPKISLNGENFNFTMDFLPSFFATGSKLEYLYSVVRMEPWESYEERLTINVLQGGGYGGTVVVTP